jgi:hypothetical protein
MMKTIETVPTAQRSVPVDDIDAHGFRSAASALLSYRERRARLRAHARAQLDALADEARRYLGAAFTASDPVSGYPIALVVRSDERLPDDYERQTPRPPTDTVSRLIVEILGHALTVEIDDAGTVTSSGEADRLADVTDVRIADAGDMPTGFLVCVDGKSRERTEVPFLRVLAQLVDHAVASEQRFLPASTADEATG